MSTGLSLGWSTDSAGRIFAPGNRDAVGMVEGPMVADGAFVASQFVDNGADWDLEWARFPTKAAATAALCAGILAYWGGERS